ncbi:MAG: MBOAT family protein [Chitinophagales bacterium]|nr:MBOAT family protein [Chitinophagales bacterium]
MLFNSFEFLIFFPVVTILYFLLPHKYRWLHLLIASCIFYCAFIPVYILILFFTIAIDYIAGIAIENAAGTKRKWYLVMSIVANVGVLAIFKYYNFFIENINVALDIYSTGSPHLSLLNIILPIGLSFHTFQAMSYTIEVYKGNQKAERHLGVYALYVMFYPQLVAGPIERPQNILHQLKAKHEFNYENFSAGIKQMIWGLFKKVVIADRLSEYVNIVFGNYQEYSGIVVVTAVVFFAFQIYCDFSGYSDIALGAARTMGIRLMLNFNRPYFSTSIREFWSRWHISLSTWFRDYLYVPLGGNRVVKWKWFRNLFITFLVSGFWHGANWTFIFWGFLHGTYLIIEILLKPYLDKALPLRKTDGSVFFIPSFVRALGTFTLVCLAWTYFRAETFEQATQMIQSMFLPSQASIFVTGKLNLILCLFFILFMETIHVLERKQSIADFLNGKSIFVRWSFYQSLILLIVLFGVFDKQSFIYFQF